MPDYTGGYTGALDSQSRRNYLEIEMQRMLQSITQSNIIMQQEQEDRKRQLAGASKGIETLIGLQPPPDTSQAPPPQAPAPGQPSMPMQPQGAPPAPTPQGQGMPPTPTSPPMGPPSQINLAPGTMTPANLAAIAADARKSGYQPPTLGPNGPPVGWNPSPTASPALGGRAPSAQQPSAPSAGGGIEAPPSPSLGVRQGQMIDPKQFVARAIKQGATPLQAYDQLKAMEPAINAHNKQVMDDFGEQAKIANMVIKYQEYLLRAAREGRLGEIGEQREQRLSAREDRLEAGKGATVPRQERTSGAAAPAGDPLMQADAEVRDNVRRTQAWGYINTRMLPYRKGTGGGRDRNDEVMQTVGQIERELNMTPEEVASMPGTWKADAASLLQATKKRDAIAGQLESFHNNLRTWDQLAKGLPPTFGGQATKDFSKKLESINFTGVRSLDDVKLRIQQQVNDPTVSAYMVAAMAAAMDYARIMQGPQSAASLTEGARKDAERLVNAAANNESRAGIIAAMDSDTQGQVKGLDTQIQRIQDRMARKTTPEKDASKAESKYVETRRTTDGRTLGKKADGTIEEVRP